MPIIDYFPPTVAVDPATDSALEGAVAEIFAIDDTDFLTPLAITDLQGVPLTNLVAGPLGVFPAFICEGHIQVVPKVGDIVSPPMTSIYGPVFLVIPDPSDVPDGHMIVASGGAWIAAAPAGISGDGSITRIVKIARSVYDDLEAADELVETTFYAIDETA